MHIIKLLNKNIIIYSIVNNSKVITHSQNLVLIYLCFEGAGMKVIFTRMGLWHTA